MSDEKALTTPLGKNSMSLSQLQQLILYSRADLNPSNIEYGAYYLQEYGIEKVGDIGLDLGLSFATLRSLSPEKFREEAIEAWLQKKDKVEERSGAPTWKSLGGVLQKMGCTEAAEKISKGISYQPFIYLFFWGGEG